MDITLVVGQLVEFDIWGGKVKYGWVHADGDPVLIRTQPVTEPAGDPSRPMNRHYTYNTIPRGKVRPVDNPLTIERWLAHE